MVRFLNSFILSTLRRAVYVSVLSLALRPIKLQSLIFALGTVGQFLRECLIGAASCALDPIDFLI